ncbi:hypothetical protein IFM47457_11186 [Aspergillus lentulus]|nr:hypothetical protein IFM47457_11186 [Aspergillus lentulus]
MIVNPTLDTSTKSQKLNNRAVKRWERSVGVEDRLLAQPQTPEPQIRHLDSLGVSPLLFQSSNP